MAEVKIIYWSGTGNTAAMAQSVADGVAAAGAEAKIIPVENASTADIADVKAFALGCPSMGAEQLEESTMEPFVEEILGSVSGKKILLFGSYGWGDGEWMRNWVEQMTGAGAEMIEAEGIIANEAPDADAQAACEAAGKELAANA
ncbi:MAG: flavodoxin [Lachnospiraceae bacterium]|nr:flavodoxin [Lachnospiraceae bacterium]